MLKHIFIILTWVFGAVIGFVAHELTHATVAALLGRRPVIHWRELECGYAVGSAIGDAAIRAAPLLIGLATAAGLWWFSLGPPRPLVPVGLGWLVYTLCGVRNDVCAPLWRRSRAQIESAQE